jgi:hypothetical protein
VSILALIPSRSARSVFASRACPGEILEIDYHIDAERADGTVVKYDLRAVSSPLANALIPEIDGRLHPLVGGVIAEMDSQLE